MIDFKYDQDKAFAAILYICHSLKKKSIKTDFHKVFKILYFAEMKHLSRYAMPITGDSYCAMDNGPVPSAIYDSLKDVRDDDPFRSYQAKKLFKIVNWQDIEPLQQPDMDELSESDLTFIEESIIENQHLSFPELTIKSHGPAYDKAERNRKIDYCDIAEEEGASSDVCDLIKLTSENERFANSL
ncbi:MAG: SocA family protein [Proteobacteria bacterium]|nr:DUF4065 domain-containing protein [Desulfobacula sp.]MBU4131536.1 SocA family protein [Pseudomonadota bacterium]